MPQAPRKPAGMVINECRRGFSRQCQYRPLSEKQCNLLHADVGILSFILLAFVQMYRSDRGKLIMSERKFSQVSTRVDVYTDADCPGNRDACFSM